MNTFSKSLKVLGLLLILPFFAACGGGEDDDGASTQARTPSSSSSSSRVTCTSWSAYYDDPATCGQGSSSGSNDGGSTSSGTVQLLVNDEFESNNTMSNANIMEFAGPVPGVSRFGFVARGFVDDMGDEVDFFAFIGERGMEYRFQLCIQEGTACNSHEAVDSFTAWFDVYDQNGNVLASTQADSLANNNLMMEIDAGLVYYVAVRAGDTMAATIDYDLKVYEAP